MSTPPSTPTIAPNPAEELAALVAKVDALSKLALDMTKLAININQAIPAVVTAQVATAVALLAPSPPAFTHSQGRTPGQMEMAFPLGFGDQQSWYVVIVGREPGLYGSSAEADAQVNGIPGQFRQKKSNRLEALAFYCHRFLDGTVDKVTPM
ncbi:hypothetical protein C8R44DRAFT_868495 [Mycena epipterygia]|nr:hypothetical protein C8R44DRAFT_868495 [Mycena epipterygia]